ncbi:MAG TPA: hypothetical protein VN653_04255 [Anaerolineales bacterium]|nr:hypothetical protein [Anaerolineales bacterium]
MNLRDELLEFIRDRWTKITTRILILIVILIAIFAVIFDRPDVLWLSLYVFIIIFLIANALYILLAREKMPAIEAAGRGPKAQAVSKYLLLMPYARIALLGAILLIPTFGFVPPFSQPVDVFLHGTPTLTPTITLTPTKTATSTLTPTSTASLTPTSTGTPRVQGVYYMLVLDASAKMSEAFGGGTKWDAALGSISAILGGLEPGANYGLVVVGGAPLAEDIDSCGEPSSVKAFFSSRQKIIGQIEQIQPAGGGSLNTAYILAKNQFEGLPDNTIHVLIYITGSSDACAGRDEWQDLARQLKVKDEAGVDIHSEIIILDQDSGFDAPLLAQQLDSLSENVNVQAPHNMDELQQSNNNVITNITNYIATTVASLVTNTPTMTSTITSTPLPGTPTVTPSITITPSITSTIGAPTTALTWTPSVTPVTPSATGASPTSVELLTVTYLTQGVGCQIDVQVRVTGASATGEFHVRNDSYARGESGFSPQTTLPVGTNWASLFSLSNIITLSGDQPAYYKHEVWFEYNGVQSNHLMNLVCPGIPPPSN